MKVEIKPFGQYEGIDYSEIFITNKQGTQISFCDLGARINRWGLQNDKGEYEQIILGHQNAQEVFDSGSYYGATIGRVAGRVELGQAVIDGQLYQLETNDKANHLHGGYDGFDLQKFNFDIIEAADEVRVEFSLYDKAGHNQYPGNLTLKVTYTYNEQNEWTIDYQATTDAPTIFNPTNHVYFNLNGNNTQSIENHLLQVHSDNYMPLKNDTIPLGRLEPVGDTVFDLREAVLIGDRVHRPEPQFDYTKGFDHPWLIDKTVEGPQAIIQLPAKNRRIEMTTTENAVVIYTHGNLTNIKEIWGQPLLPFAGVTLETQNLPNAINNPLHGDTVLRPEDTFTSRTVYRLVTA